MVSTDKMRKAIKCVQRGTRWSFSNILLPLIVSTVNTITTQATWPRGGKAGRAPPLVLWGLDCPTFKGLFQPQTFCNYQQTKSKGMWQFSLYQVLWATDEDSPSFSVKWMTWSCSHTLSLSLVPQQQDWFKKYFRWVYFVNLSVHGRRKPFVSGLYWHE